MTASSLTEKKLIDCLVGLGRGQSPAYIDDESPIYAINQKCVRAGTVDVSHARAHDSAVFVKEFAVLHQDDLCINSTGTGTIGRVGLWSNNEGRRFFADSHVTIARPNPSVVNARYLTEALQSPAIQTRMETYCFSGSTNQIELNKAALSEMVLELLSRPEQDAVAGVITTLDHAIRNTEAIIAKQQRIKTGLMQDLLTKGIDENGNIRSEGTHKFKDSPLGRIPVEWEAEALSSITSKIVDGVHHTPIYRDDGVPFVTITDMTASDGIIFDRVRYISESDHRSFIKRADPASGDVLVTKDGTLGVARIVQDSYPKFSIFVSVAQIRPNIDVCVPDLIWSFFDSGEFLVQLGALSAGTGLAHIHLEHFRKFQFRVPPLEEQVRIFRILSGCRDSISSSKSDIAKLRSIKKGLMHDLLTGEVSVTNLLPDPAAH
ncbi:MAG: restriction endonuclease subunit S [Phaeospirillum sp.]|nr:restriction endonuclease subunit S [Phaeospirillum sp.]